MSLEELSNSYTRLISFGQKRRLGVATALALHPNTLILDEITNGQDDFEKNKMMEYLSVLNKERGMTIILISHDMNIIRRYTKRAIVLKDGSIVYDGATEQLFNGEFPVESWGLRKPLISQLTAAFGVAADTIEAFCDKLIKGGEK